jgi:hypothetical protein
MPKTLQKQEKLHFEDIIQKGGESRMDFTAQTPNGTAPLGRNRLEQRIFC